MSSFDHGDRPFDLGDVLEDFFGKQHPLTQLSARIREEQKELPVPSNEGIEGHAR